MPLTGRFSAEKKMNARKMTEKNHGREVGKWKSKNLSTFRNKLSHQQKARFPASLSKPFVAVNPSPFGGEVRRGGSHAPLERSEWSGRRADLRSCREWYQQHLKTGSIFLVYKITFFNILNFILYTKRKGVILIMSKHSL